MEVRFFIPHFIQHCLMDGAPVYIGAMYLLTYCHMFAPLKTAQSLIISILADKNGLITSCRYIIENGTVIHVESHF